ncbi:AbrB/MazE/SpoVT family DNA-binding domain-containing protein [Natronolimnohabitans innermongolicus]
MLPTALREDLQLEGETAVTVVRDGADIRLVRNPSELRTCSAEKSETERIENAFRDAGDATFRGR